MDLTINEVAARLNVPVEMVHRWIRQGKIPMQHSRGQYSIHLDMLARWANEHKLKVQAPIQAAETACEPDFDGILAAMQRGGIFYDVPGDSKEAVLQAAVARIPNIAAGDREIIYEKLIVREYLASTGIGHGIALPHPRANPDIALAQPQITTCYLSQAIDYDAIDHRPVSMLMVLLSCSTKEHLCLLSKLAFYLRDSAFRDHLLTAPPQAAIFEKIASMEQRGA